MGITAEWEGGQYGPPLDAHIPEEGSVGVEGVAMLSSEGEHEFLSVGWLGLLSSMLGLALAEWKLHTGHSDIIINIITSSPVPNDDGEMSLDDWTHFQRKSPMRLMLPTLETDADADLIGSGCGGWKSVSRGAICSAARLRDIAEGESGALSSWT